MSISLEEVIEQAGYSITTSKEDAIWFLSQQDEFERLKELAEDTIDRLEEEEKEEEEEDDDYE